MNRLLNEIKNKYTLNKIDCQEFAHLKVKGMKFKIEAFNVENFGHLSIMNASGFFGLMNMQTLILIPKQIDMPIYSYDRIKVFSKDILLCEIYDTCVEKNDLSVLSQVIDKYEYITNKDVGTHWYDSIKFKESFAKQTTKKQSKELDDFILEHFKSFLNIEFNKVHDLDKKKNLIKDYVNKLLEHGGPSTDQFIKKYGKEMTSRLYKEVLFNVD